MPKQRPERADELVSIIEIVRKSPTGARRSEIEGALEGVPQRTLQFWLKSLVDDGRLIQEGRGPAARYRIAAPVEAEAKRTGDQTGVEEEKPANVDIKVTTWSSRSPTIKNGGRRRWRMPVSRTTGGTTIATASALGWYRPESTSR